MVKVLESLELLQEEYQFFRLLWLSHVEQYLRELFQHTQIQTQFEQLTDMGVLYLQLQPNGLPSH